MEFPDQLGLSESEQQQTHQQWSTFNQVQSRLTLEGFTPLDAPAYACPGYLDMDQLNGQDSRVVTSLMAIYKAWRDFSSQRSVFSQQILVETRNELRSLEALTKKDMKGTAAGKKAVSAADVRERASLTPRYTQMLLQEQEYEQLDAYYTSEASRFASGYQLLSRLITLRGQDIEQTGRSNTVGAHGTGHSPPRYG